MKKYGRRARREESRLYLTGAVILAVGISVAAWVVHHQVTRPKPLDSLTLCPASGPVGHIVLLVDKTDPLNFTQRQAFGVSMQDLVHNRVPEGYLLSVFVLGESFEATAQPTVELCNPGSDVGKSELTANLKRLRKQYLDRFVRPLEEAAESLIADQAASASPIFEMLQLVGINGFRKHSVQGPRRLIIVSDMLQNTSEFSMYRALPDFSLFVDSPYGQRVQADLANVDVEIHYLMTQPRWQTRGHLLFWEKYLDRSGARLTEVRRVEG